MIPILYDSAESLFTSNGLGRLRDVISATVTEERNGIYELDFSISVGGAHFDDIIPGRIVGVTHEPSGDIQPFDIVSYSKPIDGIVSFHAVHISYRQSGLTVHGTGINSLADALTLIKDDAEPSNPFLYTSDFTSSGYMSAADGIPKSVRQMLGGVEGSILDAYGGEYEWDKFRVILHRSRGRKRDFKIRYGVNMTDYKDDTDFQGTYTSCVPYWSGGDGGVIVIGDKVNSGLPAYDGRDICVPLDLTEKFETKPSKAQLQSLALSMMQSKQTTLPSQTISVDFVRLQDLGFEDLDQLFECQLCDTIDVIFPQYDMQGSFKIVKTVWNVLEDRYDSMELGNLQTSLAEALGITDGSQGKVIDGRVYVNNNDDVEVLGDMNVTGALTISGHSSAIGDSLTGSNESASIANGTAYTATGEEFTLTAGTWLITAGIRFNTNATGTRRICIRDVTGAANVARSRNSTNALSSYQTDLSTSCTVSVGSAGRTYAVYAQQNSGSALGAAVYWMYVRIA